MTGGLRVAFPPIGRDIWTGGQNYLANLLIAVRDHGSARVTPVLLAYPGYAPAIVDRLRAAGIEVHEDPFFAPAGMRRRAINALAGGSDSGALARYRHHGIDCVFENATFHGWRFPMPVLSWIPDFQHLHLPQFFTRRGWWGREIGFRLTMRYADRIMVSSLDALADLRRFYGERTAPVEVVPFAVPAPPAIAVEAIEQVRRSYDLPSSWFFLPNQFWQHKNHEVAIDALALALQRSPALSESLTIVCSGSTSDDRAIDYHARLVARIADHGIGARFRILGLIPYAHVQALLAGAIALINPSRFEGWSTVVEEAKSAGKPMLLSNIGVHREQADGHGDFFSPDEPGELAELLLRWQAKGTGQGCPHDVETGRRRFATGFADAVERTVAGD